MWILLPGRPGYLNYFWLHKQWILRDFRCMCQMKASLVNIRLTSRYSAGSYAFAVKGFCVLFSAFKMRSGTQLTQLHGCSLRSVGTNLILTYPYPKSFVCNLPDSGRHVTSIFQGLSPSRSVEWVGENLGNKVVTSNFPVMLWLIILIEGNLSLSPKPSSKSFCWISLA